MERLICDWCGSADVTRDAWAAWNVERQAWELSAVYDDGFCHRCACARPLRFVPVGEAAQSLPASSCRFRAVTRLDPGSTVAT